MEIKEEIKVVRYIEYDGKRFYEDGKGYWLGQRIDEDGKPRRVRLHIYVWEKHNGPVPEDYDIHHIDKDLSNNDISNLIAIPRSEHHKLHMQERDLLELIYNMETCVRPKAAEWHRSEEGREWHKELYQSTLAPKWEERKLCICQYCGKEYETPALTSGHSKFCSNNCKSAYRRKSGVDNVERTCVICGKAFITNKYSRAKTCSKDCSNVSQSRKKTGVSRRQQ